MRTSFLLAVVLCLFSAAFAASTTTMGNRSGFDIGKLAQKLEDDPEDTAKRFTFLRNARPQDLPAWPRQEVDMRKDDLVKDIEELYIHDTELQRKLIAAVTRAAHDQLKRNLTHERTCTAEQFERLTKAYESALFLAKTALPAVRSNYPLSVNRTAFKTFELMVT